MNQTPPLIVDKMSNIKCQLKELEAKHVANQSGELRQTRECLLGALRTYGSSRYELGRALRLYKGHYKAERGWMAAASIVAAAIDCDERTLFRILDDYERAAQLPAIVLEAMQDQNIDPAAHKHAALIEELVQIPEPRTGEEARVVVAGAIKELVERKKQKRKAISKSITTDVEEFANKVVRQFQDRYPSAPTEDRDEEVQYVLELVVNTLRAPIVELRQFSQPALVPKPGKRLVA
jgi:hypothetical protein